MYAEKVKLTRTNLYGNPYGDDVYTISEFKSHVEDGSFIDYDGFGYPVKDSLADKSIVIQPSTVDKIPADATHIVWYNK